MLTGRMVTWWYRNHVGVLWFTDYHESRVLQERVDPLTIHLGRFSAVTFEADWVGWGITT